MLVIPAIDLIGACCVRLYRGDYGIQSTYSEDPVELAMRFQAEGFSRLHLVDLEGARSGSGANRKAIRAILESVEVPVQVGGGIRTEHDVRELIEAGATDLILGTAVLDEPETVQGWIERWGRETFIPSLDLRKGRLQTRGWLEESRADLGEVLERLRGWGVRQVICTDVERDGTLSEPNFETFRQLRGDLPEGVALIAAGGVSRVSHLARLEEAGVSGAIVGRALYEGETAWKEWLNAG